MSGIVFQQCFSTIDKVTYHRNVTNEILYSVTYFEKFLEISPLFCCFNSRNYGYSEVYFYGFQCDILEI